jgi:integrase
VSHRQDPFEPWPHKASGFWCKKINGKVEYLSRDYSTAKRRLRQMIDAAKRGQSLTREWLEAPFSDLADEYLNDVKARRAAGTYENYRLQLLRAIRIMGRDLLVREIRRLHLAKIEQGMTGNYSAACVRDTLAAVQQVFAWAVRHDVLDVNPVAGYAKPRCSGRTRLVTAEEFDALVKNADEHFQRFLLALRWTGCRPGELRQLTWDMVDLDNGLWIIPKHKTITMQKEPAPRVIPLPEALWELCHELARTPHKQSDHVFVNLHGQPYKKSCLVLKMARLRKRAGIERKRGENLVLYSHRHTYATVAIGNVADAELAELLGHTTTRTLRRYVHFDAVRLREIQRRAQANL